jgi:hypothetical protein
MHICESPKANADGTAGKLEAVREEFTRLQQQPAPRALPRAFTSEGIYIITQLEQQVQAAKSCLAPAPDA